jgi:gliding motility-associated-like protein
MRKLLTLLSICASVYYNAQSICGGQSATLTAPNPQNLSNPQYTLNPGNFSPINGNQFQVSPSTTTSYTILTAGTGTAGPTTTSAVVTVTVNPQPQVAITLTQASCQSTVIGFNLGLTFNPSTPAPGYTITWLSAPNGILSPQQTSVTSGVLPGVYNATIGAAGGCSLYPTFTLLPNPAPANFSLVPFGTTQSITCITSSIDITASDASYSYTWSSTSTVAVTGTNSVNLNGTNLGTWTVSGQNPNSGCVKTLTFALVSNLTAPNSTVSPLTQVITCSMSGIATVSVSANPTVNIAHYITDPQGGIFTATSHTAIYSPGGVGVYTHCIVNLLNGCSNCKTFTVTSTQGYPTYSLQSPQSFTLGCNTKSVALINIVGASASTPGAGVSYTIIGPPTSTVLPPGTLSGNSTYSVNTPGNYTVVVRELPSNCETRSNISILSNTFAPDISASSPLIVLDCDHTVTVLQGSSLNENISYNWAYQTFNVPSSTVQANINNANTTNTLVNNYTLTITDNSSTCRSTTVWPIYQNLFTPKAQFSLGTASITCLTPTIVLTNTSFSQIKPNPPIAPPSQPVIGYHWFGPTPQDPKDSSTTYLAGIPGVYTLTAKDLNNGCVATATQSVDDFRDYPALSFATATQALDCGDPRILHADQAASSSITPLWTTPNNAASGPRTSYTLTNVKFPGTYTLTLSNAINGCVTSKTVAVVNGTLIADFSLDRKEGFVPLTVNMFNNSHTDVSNTSIISNWSLGNGTYSTALSTSVGVTTMFTAPGTYSVALTVRKGNLCTDTMVQFIKVLLPSKVDVPNIFTPNGDGINDLYFLNATNIGEVTFTIHDRWGHLVYELTSQTGNVVWDGKNQAGTDVAEGVYFYTMKATGTDGNTFDKTGTITLVK